MTDEQAIARCKELGVGVRTSSKAHYGELGVGRYNYMILGSVSYKATVTKQGQSFEGHSSQSIGEAIEHALAGMEIEGAN